MKKTNLDSRSRRGKGGGGEQTGKERRRGCEGGGMVKEEKLKWMKVGEIINEREEEGKDYGKISEGK